MIQKIINKECDKSKSSVVGKYGNTICLDKNMNIVGTKKGKITSDYSVFSVKEDIQLSIIDLTILNTCGGDGTCVAYNSGILEILKCKLSTRAFGCGVVVGYRKRCYIIEFVRA